MTQEWSSAGGPPQTFMVTDPATDRTNVLAVVAFVLSFFFWILAIPFGHVALSQIKRTRERGRSLAVAALILSYGAILIVGVLVATLLALDSSGQSKHPAVAAAVRSKSAVPDPRQSIAPQSTPATSASTTAPAPPVASPTAPAVPPVSPYVFTSVLGPVDDGGCATHATGQVQQVLAVSGCDDLTRWVDTTTAAGRPGVVSVAQVTVPDPTSVQSFIAMITNDGTGDVNTLIDEGDFYPGGPTTFAGNPTFSATPGRGPGQVLVLEAMWRTGATHDHDDALAPVLTTLAAELR